MLKHLKSPRLVLYGLAVVASFLAGESFARPRSSPRQLADEAHKREGVEAELTKLKAAYSGLAINYQRLQAEAEALYQENCRLKGSP
jgi:hypothetical protein